MVGQVIEGIFKRPMLFIVIDQITNPSLQSVGLISQHPDNDFLIDWRKASEIFISIRKTSQYKVVRLVKCQEGLTSIYHRKARVFSEQNTFSLQVFLFDARISDESALRPLL